jgi:hypothetical protein
VLSHLHRVLSRISRVLFRTCGGGDVLSCIVCFCVVVHVLSPYTDVGCRAFKAAVEVTALDLACATRNFAVIDLLRSRGARGLCEPAADGRGFKRRGAR